MVDVARGCCLKAVSAMRAMQVAHTPHNFKPIFPSLCLTLLPIHARLQQEAVVLSPGNRFSEVKAARALHVRQVNGSSDGNSDSSGDEEKGGNMGSRGPVRGQPLRAACEME